MYANTNNDNELINVAIALKEDEHTVMAKHEITNVRRFNIDSSHTSTDKTKK